MHNFYDQDDYQDDSHIEYDPPCGEDEEYCTCGNVCMDCLGMSEKDFM